MGYSFNGTTKIISLTAGTTYLDVRDLYSKWKEWVIDTGSPFLQTFSVVGGDPIDENNGVYVTSYFFLNNNWKIKPQESNHKLTVGNGIILSSDGSDPFVQTNGNYNVMIQYSQPIKSETVSISGSSSGGLTTEQSLKLDNIHTNVDTTISSRASKNDVINASQL